MEFEDSVNCPCVLAVPLDFYNFVFKFSCPLVGVIHTYVLKLILTKSCNLEFVNFQMQICN